MRTQRTLWALAAAIVISLPLAVLFRDVAREVIVIPLLYLIWRVGLFLRDVPALWWWAALVVAVMLIAVRSLQTPLPGRAPSPPGKAPAQGRIAFWGDLLERAKVSRYARWRLANQLAHLAQDILAYRGRSGSAEDDRPPLGDALGAPTDVQAYLQAGLGRSSWDEIGVEPHGLWFRHQEHQASPLALDPQRVVHFLEEQMEQ